MIDLGCGLTTFRAGDLLFDVDLIGWVKWYTEVSEEYAEKPYALLDAVRARMAEHGCPPLNHSQADGFLHAVMLEYGRIKKKQDDERTSASSSESTPSD